MTQTPSTAPVLLLAVALATLGLNSLRPFGFDNLFLLQYNSLYIKSADPAFLFVLGGL